MIVVSSPTHLSSPSVRNDTLGTDIKSLAINLASLLLFVLPFAAYFDRDHWKIYSGVVAVSMVLALLTPPMGWLRPHPYSDFPNNKPYPRKEN